MMVASSFNGFKFCLPIHRLRDGKEGLCDGEDTCNQKNFCTGQHGIINPHYVTMSCNKMDLLK